MFIVLKIKDFEKIYKSGDALILAFTDRGEDDPLPDDYLEIPLEGFQGMKEGEERGVLGYFYLYEKENPYEPLNWGLHWVRARKEGGVIHLLDWGRAH